MEFTEAYILTETKLKRIAALSAADPSRVFTNVMHLFNEESLRACFHELEGKKAIGSDGIDKAAYGEDLDKNLKKFSRADETHGLHSRSSAASTDPEGR